MNQKPQKPDSLTDLTMIVVYGSIGLTLIFSLLFAFRTPYPIGSSATIDPAIFGQLGDVIGGIAGTGVGILTVYLLLKTYHSQKEELIATQDALHDQRAESAIFSMLETLRQIINETNGKIRVINEESISRTEHLHARDYVRHLLLEIGRTFSPAKFNHVLRLNPETKEFHIYTSSIEHLLGGETSFTETPSATSHSISEVQTEIGKAFLEAMKPYHHNFDHYFRFFRTTLEYINSIEYTTDKQRYFKLISAQLSQDELVLIFYYSITTDENFRKLIDKQQLLTPILRPDSMLATWHHWFLIETDFNFLTELQLANKQNYRLIRRD